MTRSAVPSLTSPRVSALSARETVPGCTRAARATSRRVTGPPDAIGGNYADVCSARGKATALRGEGVRATATTGPRDANHKPRLWKSSPPRPRACPGYRHPLLAAAARREPQALLVEVVAAAGGHLRRVDSRHPRRVRAQASATCEGRAARPPIVRPPRDGVPLPRPPVRGPVPGRAARAPAVPDRRAPLVLRARVGARACGDRVVLDRPAAVRPPLRRPLAAVAPARRRRARGGRHRARGRRGQLRRDAGGRRGERPRR